MSNPITFLLDWLIGLSQEGRVGADILRQSVEVERDPDGSDTADVLLERWHAEAAGYKVRYVPTTLPDLLKIDRIIRYEYRRFAAVDKSKCNGQLAVSDQKGRGRLRRAGEASWPGCTAPRR